MGWGGGFGRVSLSGLKSLSSTIKRGGAVAPEVELDAYLKELLHAHITMLDRWKLNISHLATIDTNLQSTEHVFNNYFGIGVDANIALGFHNAREKAPESFTSRLWNKLFYVKLGAKNIASPKCRNLNDAVTLYADGEKVCCDDFAYSYSPSSLVKRLVNPAGLIA